MRFRRERGHHPRDAAASSHPRLGVSQKRLRRRKSPRRAAERRRREREGRRPAQKGVSDAGGLRQYQFRRQHGEPRSAVGQIRSGGVRWFLGQCAGQDDRGHGAGATQKAEKGYLFQDDLQDRRAVDEEDVHGRKGIHELPQLRRLGAARL